ncbi:hypothetical protein [Clostridium grantii]|uniref:FlgN protein n=1 Tax=Clostridium grantii DSM 8605 TaxID=1121316 RepID=A0A1M5W7P5_9CLOT|nr:hypothetical protein [Clostridium grantii]SHH83507.1 hypothetical protein SAMN02745207_02733 [Clostridium grantii DSM 8605]
MGSDLNNIDSIILPLNEVLMELKKNLSDFQDISKEEDINKIFQLVDKKENFINKLKTILDNSDIDKLNANKNIFETLKIAKEVTELEINFYQDNKDKIKENMLQVNKKNRVNKGYMNKLTNSYFIDKTIE